MASSLASLDAFGSSSKSVSSVTQRCRSVKRTPSGSTPGCASSSCNAMSSLSSHVSPTATLPSTPSHHLRDVLALQRLLDRGIHDSLRQRSGGTIQLVGEIANAVVVGSLHCRFQLSNRR